MVHRDKQYPLMIVPLLSLEKERSRTALSSLGGWHSERKNSEVISVTQQTVVTLLQTIIAQFYSGQK